MKKYISIALCVIFTWGACVLWNWAEAFAEMTDTNAQLFDFFAAISLFAGLVCASWFNEQMKDGGEKR